MGMRQSMYENDATQNYYKLSSEEYLLIKRLWMEIEDKPQYYGNLFFTSFLGIYPQYIKYFTLNSRVPLSVDVRVNAKFTVIMEAIGYLMLDVYRNRKQLDRLVGYVAMVHKDMRLDKQDMTNFETSFLRYLAQTFPTKMTGKCQEAITKYFNSIVNGIINKMEQFRNYEMIEADKPSRSTMTYWKERKKDWDMLLDDWNTKDSSLEPWVSNSIGNNDTSLSYTSTVEDKPIELPESQISLDEKRDEDLVTPVVAEDSTVKDEETTIKEENAVTSDILSPEQSSSKDNDEDEKWPEEDPWTSSTWTPQINMFSPRERFRARSIAREAIDPQSDPRILRRRMRSSRMTARPSISPVIQQDDEETNVQSVTQRKFTNTARERRRESQKFSFDLK